MAELNTLPGWKCVRQIGAGSFGKVYEIQHTEYGKVYKAALKVVRIDIDSDGDDEFGPGKIYQMRSCVRGRSNRQRIYSPDRIQKPLKRVEGTDHYYAELPDSEMERLGIKPYVPGGAII